MSHILPLVEELADSTTDAARAEWLLRVPDGIVHRDIATIRIILQARQFRAGIEFLDTRYAVLHATRTAEGELPPAMAMSLVAERKRMILIAKGRAATGIEGEAG